MCEKGKYAPESIIETLALPSNYCRRFWSFLSVWWLWDNYSI